MTLEPGEKLTTGHIRSVAQELHDVALSTNLSLSQAMTIAAASGLLRGVARWLDTTTQDATEQKHLALAVEGARKAKLVRDALAQRERDGKNDPLTLGDM